VHDEDRFESGAVTTEANMTYFFQPYMTAVIRENPMKTKKKSIRVKQIGQKSRRSVTFRGFERRVQYSTGALCSNPRKAQKGYVFRNTKDRLMSSPCWMQLSARYK